MKLKTLAILGALAAVLLAVAVGAYTKRATEHLAQAPSELYPGLRHRVNDIAFIRISGPKGEFHVELIDGAWRMREKGGYPIRTERIRAAVTTLSDLKVIEPKTSKPENYHLIGVQDPSEGATPVLVEMKDHANQPVVSIILGAVEQGMTPELSRRYVRKTDDPRSYFIEGVAEVEPDPTRWIDREVQRLPSAWTHDITITHPDGHTLRLFRPSLETRDFQIENLPEGATFHDERDLLLMSNVFVHIGLDDVARDEGDSASDRRPGPVARARTFDGLQITARLFDFEGATWATFEAEAVEPLVDVAALRAQSEGANAPMVAGLRTPEEIAQEIDRLNGRLGGWRFKMIDVKADQLSKRLTDLVSIPGQGG